ncbi:MAG: hypothetical protein ACK53T_00265 [Planctomycetota bacterium]|jgi:hypothetical protein
MNPFLSELYDDLKKLEALLASHGANRAMQSRCKDARNAINWLQEKLDSK